MRKSNLYYINIAKWEIKRVFIVRPRNLPAKFLSLWYHRLGHISKEKVKALQKLATSIKIAILDNNLTEPEEPCIIYIYSKQIKKLLKEIYQDSYHYLNKLFDLIYLDLCGLFSEAHDRSCY